MGERNRLWKNNVGRVWGEGSVQILFLIKGLKLCFFGRTRYCSLFHVAIGSFGYGRRKNESFISPDCVSFCDQRHSLGLQCDARGECRFLPVFVFTGRGANRPVFTDFGSGFTCVLYDFRISVLLSEGLSCRSGRRFGFR